MSLYGRKVSDLGQEEMKSMLSSLKSNWIDWEKVLSIENLRFRFLAESSETSIPGKVLDDNFWPAAKNEVLTISIPREDTTVPVCSH